MKRFTFYHKNNSTIIQLIAENFEEAEILLEEIVKDTWCFVVVDEEGEQM